VVIYGAGGYNRYTIDSDGHLVPLYESFSTEAKYEAARTTLGLDAGVLASKKRGTGEPPTTDRRGLTTVTRAKEAPGSDVGHKRETNGRYVGAPDWGRHPASLGALRIKLRNLTLEGEVGATGTSGRAARFSRWSVATRPTPRSSSA
jgi:hypothetical protein